LTEGLRTGAADVGGDGYVSVDEAYNYAYHYVQASGANQTPQRWLSGSEGAIVLARSPAGVVGPDQRTAAISPLAQNVPTAEINVAVQDADRIHDGRVREARLIFDAERIAQSITNEDEKAEALSDIAEALAATDPDRAEQIAQSITDKVEKVWALGSVAEVVATTDPDRAARIIAVAERGAHSITDEDQKELAMMGIAMGLAANDPDRAERIAWSIPGRAAKRVAQDAVVERVAATDPDRAERIVQSITPSHSKGSALIKIAKALVTINPDRAMRLLDEAERAAKLPFSLFERDSVLCDVAEVAAAIDPDRAEAATNPSPTRAIKRKRCAASLKHSQPRTPTAPNTSPNPSPLNAKKLGR
jgi:hypothetical protein